MSHTKTTQIKFTGKASEYFGIWIVNLLLSILTLGIYSAWAKVRRKKYFYHNTQIDNTGFDYHANPINILKGRIVAFMLFIAYAFGGELNFFIPIVAVIVFFLALPWLVVRASLFNARNSSHRGLRFDFVGKVGEAALIYILLPIVTLFSLYLAWPFMDHQRNKFMVNNHKFGMSQFDFKAKVSSFYKVYAIVLIVPLFIGLLAAVAVPAYKAYEEKANKAAQHSVIDFPFIDGFVGNQKNNQIQIEENQVYQESYEIEPVYSGKYDYETQQNDKYQSESVEDEPLVEDNKSFEETVEETKLQRQEAREKMISDMLKTPSKVILVLVFVVGYLILIFSFLAYFKSRLGNLVWSNTSLDNFTFISTLRARDYLWIYLSNIVAIALTFGLATPWAQVRLARYRASRLKIVGDVDFDQFVGHKKEEVKATGEEIADFFDVDFSFG